MLLELCQKGVTDPQVLAKELGRKPRGVLAELNGLGFVVVEQNFQRTTTTEVADKGLLAHEEALKVLAGAVELFLKSGQDMLELQRLRVLADALQTCDSVLEKFEGWIEIESCLLDMDKKIAELKTKGNA